MIAELENIDDDCDMFGVQMVKLKDPPFAKRYGIKTPGPCLLRNGNPLAFDGDLISLRTRFFEWLTDDNRELEDENRGGQLLRMLDKLGNVPP